LLKGGAAVNAQASHGFTALHAAVIKGNAECVRLLLDHGADVEARAIDDKRALHYCCSHGWIPIGAALLDAGASIEATKLGGMTPLLEAGWCNRTEMCEFVISRGA
ncbi:ankyrin, partial [Pseudovirgaria hyperparasitica]